MSDHNPRGSSPLVSVAMILTGVLAVMFASFFFLSGSISSASQTQQGQTPQADSASGASAFFLDPKFLLFLVLFSFLASLVHLLKISSIQKRLEKAEETSRRIESIQQSQLIAVGLVLERLKALHATDDAPNP